MRFTSITLLLILLAFSPALAQESMTPYAWEDGDIALIYPSGWDTPYATTMDGDPAQVLAAATGRKRPFY